MKLRRRILKPLIVTEQGFHNETDKIFLADVHYGQGCLYVATRYLFIVRKSLGRLPSRVAFVYHPRHSGQFNIFLMQNVMQNVRQNVTSFKYIAALAPALLLSSCKHFAKHFTAVILRTFYNKARNKAINVSLCLALSCKMFAKWPPAKCLQNVYKMTATGLGRGLQYI